MRHATSEALEPHRLSAPPSTSPHLHLSSALLSRRRCSCQPCSQTVDVCAPHAPHAPPSSLHQHAAASPEQPCTVTVRPVSCVKLPKCLASFCYELLNCRCVETKQPMSLDEWFSTGGVARPTVCFSYPKFIPQKDNKSATINNVLISSQSVI